jgi:hypothetical protein
VGSASGLTAAASFHSVKELSLICTRMGYEKTDGKQARRGVSRCYFRNCNVGAVILVMTLLGNVIIPKSSYMCTLIHVFRVEQPTC